MPADTAKTELELRMTVARLGHIVNAQMNEALMTGNQEAAQSAIVLEHVCYALMWATGVRPVDMNKSVGLGESLIQLAPVPEESKEITREFMSERRRLFNQLTMVLDDCESGTTCHE